MVLVTFVEADLWRLEALQCPVRDPFLPPQRQPLFEVGLGDGLKLKINQCNSTATWHVDAVNVAVQNTHKYLIAQDHNEETKCASSSSSAA